MSKEKVITLIIILFSFLLSFYFYPQMPQPMAIHWNTQGQVNGYMPKFWSLFLIPLTSLGLFFLFLILPFLDPLKDNFKKFKKPYERFLFWLNIFLLYVYFLILAWNKGLRFNIVSFLIPALGFLFYLTGALLEKTQRNWFIGIRTPWTLSSEIVWNKTHKRAGKLFKIVSVIIGLSMFWPTYVLFFVLLPLIFIIIYITIYSYKEYQKIKNSSI